MLLAEASKVYFGNTVATKVYLGTNQIWPGGFNPNNISGLVTWLDAKDYTTGSWTNKGSGPAVTIPGTPAPTVSVNQLNGKPLVRFKTNEGKVRSTWPYPPVEWTLVYLVRWVGPNAGRAFTVQYPPSNLLIGMHTAQRDSMYNNGTWIYSQTLGTAWDWTAPGPWRMYGSDSTQSMGSRFFVDGTEVGNPVFNVGAQEGFYNGWGLSGYGTSTEETMDIEVAELVLYNRKLTDVERQQVEGYIQQKWFGVTYDPDTQAFLNASGIDVSYAPIVDNLVLGLKQYNLWSKMSAIYPMIGGTSASHKWNLKDPRDTDNAYRLTFAGEGIGTHTTAMGYRANPVGQTNNAPGRANTYLTPSSVLADINSTHLSFYSLAAQAPGDRCEMGNYTWAGGAQRFHIIGHYNGGLYYYGMGEEGGTSTPTTASSGLFVSTRIAADNQRGYRNGVSLAQSAAAPSGGLPTVPVNIGAISGYAQGPSDLPCGFASIGSGLTAGDVANLYTVVQEYQTALGRQRSPIE